MAEMFAWAESASTSLEEQPAVRKTAFGDGYQQRAPDGLNHITQVWNVRFDEVGQAAGDAIIAFFRSHGGWKRFDWPPMWSSTPIGVICTRWSRTATDEPGISSINARFEQVFEP